MTDKKPLRLLQTTLRPILKIPILKRINDLVKHRKSPLHLWFDDGYAEDYTIIYPLLKRYNLAGTLAITTSNIGKTGFLNIEQIKNMQRDGWKIASHGVTHRNFRTLSLVECEQELRESFKWIQATLGTRPATFFPPYGISQITPTQKKLILKIYGSIYTGPYHFHSKHWRKKDATLNPLVQKNEHETLNKILAKINDSSPYFKCELRNLRLPKSPPTPQGYTLIAKLAKDTSNYHRIIWEKFNEKPWKLPNDALVFFVEFGNQIVATEYAIARNGIGTLHAAIVDPKHRRLGFYRLMSIKGLEYLIGLGVSVFELHTGVRRLWHFWESLGFRRVANVAVHAQSGAPRIETFLTTNMTAAR